MLKTNSNLVRNASFGNVGNVSKASPSSETTPRQLVSPYGFCLMTRSPSYSTVERKLLQEEQSRAEFQAAPSPTLEFLILRGGAVSLADPDSFNTSFQVPTSFTAEPPAHLIDSDAMSSRGSSAEIGDEDSEADESEVEDIIPVYAFESPAHSPDNQNTHNSSVNLSVTRSLKMLFECYKNEFPIDGITFKAFHQLLSDIFEKLGQSKDFSPEKKELIHHWLSTKSLMSLGDVNTSFSLFQIISLVWVAVSDKNCFQEQSPLTDKDIHFRQLTFFNVISHWTDETFCFMGLRNDLLSILECCHPCVQIERVVSLEEQKRYAGSFLGYKLVFLVNERLLSLELTKAHRILSNWPLMSQSFINILMEDGAKELKKDLLDCLNKESLPSLSHEDKLELIQQLIDNSLEYIPYPETLVVPLAQKIKRRTQHLKSAFEAFIHSIETNSWEKPTWPSYFKGCYINEKQVPSRMYKIYHLCKKALKVFALSSKGAHPKTEIESEILLQLEEGKADILKILEQLKSEYDAWHKSSHSSKTMDFYQQVDEILSNIP